ncbi:thioredoxin [Streptomyces sp. WAC 04229]|uniref:thioredoxin n=1 Tax=Streptomyces sp. WAC 04229 TaxID=2203206 RepID=UPI000F74ACB5|nr:thioredoxin [Streptomyces sp. WAC 04229]RSN48593.1 thioredoxin [Streptomyces sp. WAC 04229]
MSSLIKPVSDASFDQEVLKAEGPVLVDFWAVWCGPCKQMNPVLDDIASEHEGDLTVVKVDVDHNQGVASRYGIRSIPTLLLFKGGKVVDQAVGAIPKSKLLGILGEHI